MFDFVLKSNKNNRVNYISRKTDACNEYKTLNLKGTFHDFQQNGKLFYSLFYLVTTDCKTSVTATTAFFFLMFSFHDLVHHTSSPHQSGYKLTNN